MDEGLVTPLLGVKKVWNGYDPHLRKFFKLFPNLLIIRSVRNEEVRMRKLIQFFKHFRIFILCKLNIKDQT